jgi:ribosome-binding ATPase YchF (GTP1/OBG family)
MVYLLNISSRDYLRYTLHSLTWIDELTAAVNQHFNPSPAPPDTSTPSSPTNVAPSSQTSALYSPIRFIVMSVEFEESYREESLVDSESFEYYLQANPFHRSALGPIFQSLYSQMDLIPFYTATPTECKVYYIPQGTMAPEAGGLVDSLIERRFVCANVMAFDDLVEFENEFTLRRMGKLIQQGRKYIVNEGDIISFQSAK